MQNYINIVLGAKGGIGKTIITTYLAEFLMVKKKQAVSVLNTDTSNKSLTNFKYFVSESFDFKDDNGSISPVSIQNIATQFSNSNLIIDTGANSYYAWLTYLKDMYGVPMLESSGSKVLLHVPIVPGQMLSECLNCLREIISANLGAKIILHLNSGFNSFTQGIKLEKLPPAKDLFSFPLFKEFKGKVDFIVEEPKIPLSMKYIFDSLRNQFITFSELADCSMEELTKYKITDNNNNSIRPASIVEKKSSLIIRQMIFDNYSVLNPIYDK